MDNSKKNDIGTKLMNELMVDIIGAVIPGLLFIIVVFISIGTPCCIYLGPTVIDKVANLLKGGGWWVMLIICIIFSYVIGQIFYRANIALPDGIDVTRQVRLIIKQAIKHDKQTLCRLIKQQIILLQNRFCNYSSLCDKYPVLYNACSHAMTESGNIDISVLKAVLFPEDFKISNECKITGSLSSDSKEVIKTYKRLILRHRRSYFSDKEWLRLAAYYCILYSQMELGCATAQRCEFPYLNYYKYLLKRDLIDLLEYVDWYTIEGRTKNRINSLKIKIQIFASEAYALINKNESHVRMASSTWHISRLLIIITATTSLITSIGMSLKFNERDRHKQDEVVYRQETSLSQQENNFSRLEDIVSIHEPGNMPPTIEKKFIAFLSPFLMLLFVLYIKTSITKFIHYQRMREIQYTLQIYEQCEDIIRSRQRPHTNNRVLIL